MEQRNRWMVTLAIWLPILLGLLTFTIIVSVSIGSANIDVKTVWLILLSKIPFVGGVVDQTWSSTVEKIIIDIRMPRVLLGVLVGAALASAGTIYQAVLRNPLADPFILGVSSGSALGACLVLLFGWKFILLGNWTLPVVAFSCGMITLVIVYFLAKVNRRIHIETLILSGVVVQAFIAAALSLILALADERMQTIMFWLMGSLTLTNWGHHMIVLPFVLVGVIITWFMARELNILSLGEETAYYTGVSVPKVRVTLLVIASLITGAAVSVSGTIGFVGLVIPHIIRLLFGSDNRIILPLSIIGGAIFLVLADTLARTILSPRELPIGIITAFLGAPFFAYLLRKKRTGYF
ncbi:FecCD family ABC transporter permease [Salirhabdus salicampi]|uniref:FecCD family ABC transporter permease n=1 Tax=Salirhabdus salicampi TaxID=476102 RepID=UPI0020C42997|nr:iron ABC transporter permease [Salirhabdus salicampi]MCP8618110.1 iron ABC transporter permease [Salirhabdus salicampi]